MELPREHPGGKLVLRAPGRLRLLSPPPGATLSQAAPGEWALLVPMGITRLNLQRG